VTAFSSKQERWFDMKCVNIHSGKKYRMVDCTKETDRKWEEGGEISLVEFAATEYGRKGRVVASEDVKNAIRKIGINRCARESGFDRKNFVRKLVRDVPVKRNSYNEFARWLKAYNSRVQSQ